jgi:DNA repair exonuclease SbcCD nuclease subunit
MKFLHAADIHLDSPPAGVARAGAVPAHVRHDATRRAFSALVDLARREQVDFVLIAGDLYDSEQRDFGTALFFAREMARLVPIPCVMIRGNHDAQSQITKSFQPPPNVRVLSSRRAETVLLDGVAIHGRSFPDRAVAEDFASAYPARVPGRFNVGLLHTSLEGAEGHDTYAPCSVETLRALGYDYWALGHIHTRRIVERSPSIVFPGNIQGRNPREVGARGCMIVTAEGGAVTDIVFHAVDVMRWAAVRVGLDGVEDRAALAGRVRERMDETRAAADGRPVLVRVFLEGATGLHGSLLADPSGIEGECRLAAETAGGEVHVERVVIETRQKAESVADVLALASLEPAFRASFEEEGLVERLLEETRRLRSALPGDVADAVPADRDGLERMLDEAWALVGGAFGAP